jgi:hypothetical protein
MAVSPSKTFIDSERAYGPLYVARWVVTAERHGREPRIRLVVADRERVTAVEGGQFGGACIVRREAQNVNRRAA